MPPPRPSAMAVSFPELAEELRAEEAAAVASVRTLPRSSTSRPSSRKDSGKRRRVDSSPEAPSPKRRHSAPNKENTGPLPYQRYTPRTDEVPEDKLHISLDEDSEDSSEDKPIRLLSNFCIFDPKHKNQIISLEELEKDDSDFDREVEAVGDVRSYVLNDEDAGQEDDLVDEFARARLTAIMRFTIDYTKEDDPVWIETVHAWYILESPSRSYQKYFHSFLKAQKIAQIVISSTLRDDTQTYTQFEANFVKQSLFGKFFDKTDLWASVPEISAALEGLEDGNDIADQPILRHLLRKSAAPSQRPRLKRFPPRQSRAHPQPQPRKHVGNIDLLVLKAENQTPTHVTPLIDSYAYGFFREKLYVVGPRPARPRGPTPDQQKEAHTLLCRLLATVASGKRPKVSMHPKNRVKPRSFYLNEVELDGKIYAVKDYIVIQKGKFAKRRAPDLPRNQQDVPYDATLSDYFWVARVLSIDSENQTFHVQWFEHSSDTAMDEISDPQELFLTNICNHVDFGDVFHKVKVHDHAASSHLHGKHHDYGEFYFKLVYDSHSGTFLDVDTEQMSLADSEEPPNNCPVCLLGEQRNSEELPQPLQTGVAWHAVNYHIHDFVMIKAVDGPCQVGHIIRIQFPESSRLEDKPFATVNLLGRIGNVKGRPRELMRDERHLFLTDDELEVNVENFIGLCTVLHRDSTNDLQSWLSQSPHHFYCRYKFPSSTMPRWSEKIPIQPKDILVCKTCTSERFEHYRMDEAFKSGLKPLRAFDPFGGVGAFGLGLEEGGCIQVTHTVEISPSASETLRLNSPNTVVYNECANKMLQYAIKSHEGHHLERPKSLYDGTPLPLPPKPGDIDCIVAGFPCQPHSRMNMYQKASDVKSNLILNVLSWVDFLKPKYCIFENVRGFLSFRLNATQAGIHRVEGGIEMGGLKFVLHAMVAMNYQVRFGLLQAAHYGTPQARVRFFMIAAKHGCPLPELPQPTHEFPLVDALRINFTNGDCIEPIRTMKGTAPHAFVTIEDAISDLPRFDWKNPGKESARYRELLRGRDYVPSIKCDNSLATCGLSDPVEYHHEPQTTFQQRCREKPVGELQHFTRTYAKLKVERVVNIPLNSKADYRGLEPHLWEWQFANAASSVAKSGFRPGLYGRLDKDRWFPTTVTNMDPTAKQSRVLNPYCRRIVTVRELARSQGFPDNFQFVSVTGDVVTMHRQIGNAVPINLGAALGRELRKVMFKDWQANREKAIVID